MNNLKKDVIDKRLLNLVKYHYLSLRLVWSLFTCQKVWKQMQKQAQCTKKLSKVQTYTTDLASYSLTQWQLCQLTLKWLSGARAQDKNKQYYCHVPFFLIFIQLCDSRKNHYLTREFHVKLHLKTDIALIASRFVRYRFSRAI